MNKSLGSCCESDRVFLSFFGFQRSKKVKQVCWSLKLLPTTKTRRDKKERRSIESLEFKICAFIITVEKALRCLNVSCVHPNQGNKVVITQLRNVLHTLLKSWFSMCSSNTHSYKETRLTAHGKLSPPHSRCLAPVWQLFCLGFCIH